MQCATCEGKPTAQECAMRMADGRAFTDYRPRCAVQADFYRQIGAPFSAYDSRMYLQKNAVSLMKMDRTKAEKEHCTFWGDYEAMDTEMATEAVVRCTPQSCTRAYTTMDLAPGMPALGDKRSY